MPYVTVKDGTRIFYQDAGQGPVVMFSHGWPLSGDDWERQIVFLNMQGFRTVAHDRRGHGRSDATWDHNDMDTYSDDLAAVIEALDLHDIVLVGHSTGGGEVTRYLGRHGTSRVKKAVLLDAVPPVMVKKDSNPEGTPMEVFDGFRRDILANRSQLYYDIPMPFYGMNRPGATVSEGLRLNWWRQGMMGDLKSHYDCIKVFSETDMTEDLKKIDVPLLIVHGDDDQIVPIHDSAMKSAELAPHATLKIYEGAPHGLMATHTERFNADLLDFIKE